MERLLAVGFYLFCAPAFFCLIGSIPYFAWHRNWTCAGILIASLLVGPITLALFMLPANLLGFVTARAAKSGSRALTAIALFVNLTAVNACAAVATIAVFLTVVWYGFDTNHYWAFFAGFGAATFPGCWIAIREKMAIGGLMLAVFAGAASTVMLIASLTYPFYILPGAIVVYLVGMVLNWIYSARRALPRKPRNAFELVIFQIYGNPPPPNTADPREAIRLASEHFGGVVSQDEVRSKAVELNSPDMPYNTHGLALSVMLAFFRRADLVARLSSLQMQARATALKWFTDGNINPMELETFENDLYKRYKGSLPGAATQNPL